MSDDDARDFVNEGLGKIVLHARDGLRMHLLEQEIPFFFYQDALDGKKIDPELFVKWRGFNEEEATSMRALAAFFNDNSMKIRLLWARVKD
jgi:hypothetical protein